MGQSAPRPDGNGAKRFGRKESFDEMEEPHGIVVAACPRADGHLAFATPRIMLQGFDGRVIGKQRFHRLARGSIGARSPASEANHERTIRRHVGAGFDHGPGMTSAGRFAMSAFSPIASASASHAPLAVKTAGAATRPRGPHKRRRGRFGRCHCSAARR